MTVSRRTVLGLAAAAAASVVAGCTRGSGSATRAAGSTPAAAATTGATGGGPASGSTSVPTATNTTPAHSTAAAPVPHGPARVLAHGPRTRAEVALTFHGAGDPAIARDLLAVFAAHQAHGHRARRRHVAGPERGTSPATSSAPATSSGNHTYRHLDINSLARGRAAAEIMRCRDVLVAAGRIAGRALPPVAGTDAVRRWCGGWPVQPGTRSACPTTSTPWTTPTPAPTAVRANVRRGAGRVDREHALRASGTVPPCRTSCPTSPAAGCVR